MEVEKGPRPRLPGTSMCPSTQLKKADDYKKTHGFGRQNKKMKKANFEDVDDVLHVDEGGPCR